MKQLLTSIGFFVVLMLPVICQAQGKEFKHNLDSLNKFKVGLDFKPTRYKTGFTYMDNRGVKNTLLKWTKVGVEFGLNIYRWRIRMEGFGVTALGWTDDCWIDIHTQKAYLNERTHKIVYYDSAASNEWSDVQRAKKIDTNAVYYKPILIENMAGVVTSVTPEIKDTIPILMLVCDTSHPVFGFQLISDTGHRNSIRFTGHSENIYGNPDIHTYWVKGYEVRDVKYQYANVSVDPNHQMSDGAWPLLGRVPIYKQMPYYTFLKYLDADKKELSKNIIVWMYNEIKS